MSGYGQPAAPRPASPGGQQDQTAQIVSYVAGGLGVLMFVWGFLKWFTEGEGDGQLKVGGYAASSSATGAIACSLIAGLVVLLHTFDKKPVGVLPLAFAGSGLLLTIGAFIGKGSISSGGSSEKIGAGIGLILALITAILQTGALGYLHFGLAAAKPAGAAGAGAWQPSSGYGQQPGGGYGQPQSGSPSPQYGSAPSQSPGQQPSYGSYGGGQQQAPQQQRPSTPSYGQPGQSSSPQQSPPASPPSPQHQPTQHLPGGAPPSGPPQSSPPPSGPPSSAQPPAPGQYGPPSQYGQPGQSGQNPPPGQYGPPQR